MITESDILTALDHSNDGYYCNFVPLNHPYSYIIDSRLNLFRAQDEWAIAAETFGYNPRGGWIELTISYYGNCLINLEEYNGRKTNYCSLSPIDEASYEEATSDELLNPEVKTITVRGLPLLLSHNKADYEQASIELTEIEPDRISMEEVGRLLITQSQSIFRATDEELHKSIPTRLNKILVLNEWHHKDFTVGPQVIMSDEDILRTYKLNRSIDSLQDMSIGDLTAAIRSQEQHTSYFNNQEWIRNRPSSYETWQQIAKVLATGNIQHYQPTLIPNTHWSNWPESGAL